MVHSQLLPLSSFSSRPQSPDALETRVRQLHDRGNSRTAVRRHHVRVQHRGGQHGEETARGLFCPGPQPNPLHHHLLSKVLYSCVHFLLYLKIVSDSKCSCVGWRCRLGCPGFTKPEYRPSPVDSRVAKSLFFPDEAINKHPRFR